MSLPVSASAPDLVMTIPTGFAAALGIWFATASAILFAEAGLARRIAKFRLFSTRQAPPVTEVPAALRLEQQCVAPRQRRGARPANRQPASGFQISRILLRIAAFAFGLGVALPTLAQTISGSSLNITGQSTLQGDVVTCSGHPWIDVRCNGAVADGNHDDTSAINNTISAAIANNWPVRLTAGTYKVTSRIMIDYAAQPGQGFRLISDGAVIDGRTIASGPVLQIQCGGGTTSSPTGCFYFREEGTLFVNGNTPAYVVVVGKTDFSDAHNSAKFDHLIVNNANTAAAGGGCQFNYVLDSDVYAVCVAAGGAAGLAFEQAQFSRISGAGTAAGSGGRGVVLENGYNFSNTFFALDLEVSPTCLSITFIHNGLNTFVSPYFDCVTAVNATASDGNVLINPNYGGATVNYGPLSTGISVIGTGSRDNWLFPVAGSYVAKPIDDGLSISNYNAPGASMSVTLPALATVNAGWGMGFASDNGKGMTITTTSGSIISGGKSVGSITMGAGNYEYVRLQSDGNNFRIVSSTRNTRLANGFEPPPWPSNWLFPASSGYAADLSDNGNVLSSYNSAAGLTVTLPSANGLPDGWSMGFATDNDKGLVVQVNSTTGGHIVWPGSGGSQTSLPMANTSQGAYEFMVLQYDGNGNFRVLEATPATAQAIGMIGAGGISRWSFPTVSSYSAAVADNGNVISSLNSPASYLAVTLPSTTAMPIGWTIGIATDGNKTAAVQTNSTSGGRILYPGSGATTTSASLAGANYELLVLQFDGGNFRVIQATPATATLMGISGNAPGINRWSFPAVGTYAASQSDIGNALSSYNTPVSSLTVTLPPTTAIRAGWTMGFATDNGKTMTVQVNGASGGHILYPAGATGSAGNSVTAPMWWLSAAIGPRSQTMRPVTKFSKECLFEISPNPVTAITRMFSNTAADGPAGAQRTYYEKVFIVNNNTGTALTGTQIEVGSEAPSLPSGALLDLALTTALNDTGTAANRQAAPPSGIGSFISQPAFVSVPGPGNLPSGAAPNTSGAQGVWLRLTLPAGTATYKGWADLRTQGTTT